jgi:DNA-binding NarL/FixJ family response regulator
MILVIDEHSVYRSGLRDVIELKIEQCRVMEASTIAAVDKTVAFDLILIDSASLDQPSLRLLKEIREIKPKTRFAVMSNANTRADVLNCLSAGFHGFVYKLQSDDEWLRAVTDLLSGRIYVPEWLANMDEIKPTVPPSLAVHGENLRLTPRQNDILPLLAQGMSNKEIARLLCIAEGTTKIHTAALLRALGARNRTEAAFLAAKLVGMNNRADHQAGVRLGTNGSGRIRLRA